MGKIVEILKSGRILVSDGACGTALQQRGLKPGECPEAWSVNRFDDVVEIAQSYINAGADMVETNSFGGTCFKLEHYGLADKAGEINEAAARAARRAAGDKLVLGSMGPTGKMLLMGDVTADDLYKAFKEQAQALERGGVDAICIETMSDAEEAAIAVRAAKENTGLEVLATFTFDKTKQGDYRTMMGLTPEDAAAAALDAGADIIGTNCGNGIERMIDIVKVIKKAFPHSYILVHANAGLPENIDGRDTFPETPEMMAELVPKLIAAGANIVGGCCGTTGAHIAAIKKAVDEYCEKVK